MCCYSSSKHYRKTYCRRFEPPAFIRPHCSAGGSCASKLTTSTGTIVPVVREVNRQQWDFEKVKQNPNPPPRPAPPRTAATALRRHPPARTTTTARCHKPYPEP